MHDIKGISQLLKGLLVVLLTSGLLWFGVRSTTSLELPQEGSPPVFYSTNTSDDLRLLYLQAINKAKKSIQLMIYSLQDPYVIQALLKQARQGVDIEIVYDPKASQGLASKLGEKIRASPCLSKGLMHLKTLVIDEEQVYVGSANLTSASLKFHDNLSVGFFSPSIAQLLLYKQKQLQIMGRVDQVAHLATQVGKQKVEFWLLPDDTEGLNRIKELIRSAKKTVHIAMFTWTRMDLAHEVADAKKRGVQVAIALDRNAAFGAGRRVTQFFQERGIPLIFGRYDSLLHHKMLLIDQKTVLTGSTNWTKAAFTRNQECFMIVEKIDEKQIRKLCKLWENIAHASRPNFR